MEYNRFGFDATCGNHVEKKEEIKFPFKRKACQVYRVGYGRGRIW